MKYLIILLLLSAYAVQAQKHFDFTVIDSDGVEHTLYEDYLDKGYVVVTKVFFVDCPPCNAIAKDIQEVYEEWGEGTADVQFIEITTSSRDDDNDVKGYKARHGITFPSISDDGQALEVTNQYKTGFFGTYWGTPSFAIIRPDGTTEYRPGLTKAQLSAAIADAGALGPDGQAQNTTYNVDISWAKGNEGQLSSVEVELKSADGSASYMLNPNAQENFTFIYPSEDYPAIDNPMIEVRYTQTADAIRGVNGLDVLKLRKHVLGIEEITDEDRLVAADIDGNGRYDGLDVLRLLKVALEVESAFPSGISTYVPKQSQLTLEENLGETVNIGIMMIKMGDIN